MCLHPLYVSLFKRNLPCMYLQFVCVCKYVCICICHLPVCWEYSDQLYLLLRYCPHPFFLLLHVHCKLRSWASVLYVQLLLQWVQVNSCASGNAAEQNNEQECVSLWMCSTEKHHGMSEMEKTHQVALLGIVLDNMRGQFYFFGLKLDWNIYSTSSHMGKEVYHCKSISLPASAVRNLLAF